MDCTATQIYEEEDFECTQRISQTFEETELIQVGILSIDSTAYQIKNGTTKIGRLSSCDICINDMTVSKIHAEIEADRGQSSTWISDLLSVNKTKLNNSILRPKRLYELKDGSVIEFGKVRAVYRTYRPTNNTVIPETPAPARQRVTGTIIPNTPDSSINNSSATDDDGSVILGTQTEEGRSVFRRPLLPQQRQSTSISKKNTSRGENDDSQIDIRLRMSVSDGSGSEGVSIFDMETQKYEKGPKTASSSIHDMETQNIPMDMSKHLEANVAVKKRSLTLNRRDKMTGSSAANISKMETQNYTDNNEQQHIRKNKTEIPDATVKKLTMNIHDLETQNYTVGTAQSNTDIRDAKKPTTNIHDLETQNYLAAKNTPNRTAKKSAMNIHDLETQNYLAAKNTPNRTAKKSAMNIHDLETQNYNVDNAENNTETCKLAISKNKVQTTGSSMEQVEHDIHNLETQKLNTSERTVEDIYDMETQLTSDGITRESSNSNCADKNKDMSEAGNSGASCENVKKLSLSRSNSPENILSLNLSSPELDENCSSSPLDQSAHLLESSDLLEYFADGIDKPGECNASTPKPRSKTSPHKDNAGNTANASDQENDNEEDNIHDLPTQRNNKLRALLANDSETDEEKVAVKRKAPKSYGKPPPTRIVDDDSETDAEEYLEELTKKQDGPSEAPNKSRDTNVQNNIDLETSADSDDMFDMLTQPTKNHSKNDTSSPPVNQQSKTDKSDEVVNDMAPTQPLLPRKTPPKITIGSKDSSPGNNQHDVDDTAPTQNIHANISVSESNNRSTSSNLDCKDIDYETAPTQVIGEVTTKKNSTRSTSDRAKDAESPRVDLNDTLERNLNEMFDDVNNEDVHEHALMSTQCLEDILQFSQCDNDSLPNKSTVEKPAAPNNAPQTKGRKSSRFSYSAVDDEVKNKSNVNDSQNSDIYFATITTRRKRNVIRDTQDIIDLTENATSRCVSNILRKSKKQTKDENSATKSSRKGKRVAKSKDKTDATATGDLVDDTVNKIVGEAASSENNEKIVRKTKSVTKRKNGTAPETNEQTLKKDSREVDSAKGDLASVLDICAPDFRVSSPPGNEKEAQKSVTLYESDDDILRHLPAVRISGTLSNPPSPSASSTSVACSTKSKQGDARNKKKGKPPKNKSPLTRKVENPSRIDNGSSLLSHDKYSTSVIFQKINKMLEADDDSEDSDSVSSYKRFKQMADRMLSKERDVLEEQDKDRKVVQSKAVPDKKKKKGARSSPDVSQDPRRSPELRGSRNLVQTSSRTTRSSNKLDTKNSYDQQTNEASMKVVIDRFTRPETKPTAANRKRGLNTAEKKRKADQKVVGKASEIASRETRETSDVKTENVDAVKSNVIRTRRKATGSQAATRVEDTNKGKNTQAKERETLATQVMDKTLKVVLKPITSLDDESQEVEMIMARKVPSDVRDEHSSVREGSNARTFQRESRNTRGRKRANTNVIDSSSTESSMLSSDTSDLENVQFSSIAPPRAKRGRTIKNSAPPPQETPIPEHEVFKRPTRVTRYSANLTDNNIMEHSTNSDSRNSMQYDGSLNIKLSRSKTAGTKNTWKVEMKESSYRKRTADTSISSEINTSMDSSIRVSTPTRARRSASSMSISSPSTARHRILFTGITEDKYDNLVKTLGGSKVETPKLCTVLVTDKVRRTYKFLCALAKGVPIVSINWLTDSELAAQFLNWENYILKDLVAEAKFGFRLRKSLDRAKEKGLLVGYTIVLTPNIEQPPTKELKDMITCCGGKALLSPPTTWPEKAIIISREQDLPNAKKFLAKAPKTVTVQSAEFIMIGILRQEVDFDKHRLI